MVQVGLSDKSDKSDRSEGRTGRHDSDRGAGPSGDDFSAIRGLRDISAVGSGNAYRNRDGAPLFVHLILQAGEFNFPVHVYYSARGFFHSYEFGDHGHERLSSEWASRYGVDYGGFPFNRVKLQAELYCPIYSMQFPKWN